MKKTGAFLLIVLMLTGCTGKRDELNRAMSLRAKLLGCESCSFTASITADYVDAIHTFSMNCQGDNDGSLTFEVTKPESIAGITGKIDGGAGMLTFDDVALEFSLLADDQVTPVSGPWILLKTLLGGYLTACSEEEENLRVTIYDSYEDDALQMEIWLDGENLPIRGEIFYEGRRIVSMDITNFQIQ